MKKKQKQNKKKQQQKTPHVNPPAHKQITATKEPLWKGQ